MDSKEYLISYGWKEGEAFREGGLKRPILVKHKRDKKGLGNAPGRNDGEAWWERLFDGHLKNLDVSTDSNNGSIKFTQNEAVATAVSKSSSPLYRWFVKGEGLKGTITNLGKKEEASFVVSSASSSKGKKRRRRDEDDNKVKRKKLKKDKKTSNDSESKKKKKKKSKKESKKGKKSKHSSDEGDKSKHKKSKKSKKHKKEESSARRDRKEHI
ncbi:AIC_G0043090.mRNA.1.CDS.1 [Saccharomyces cerevisiae]|uniref:Tma23p n=1 Tax=Saccharomyces cerevisiae (strain Lalvin EC1118 / Prise de mousse) TaxID=643680 RepID=C8ZFD5_YEAS8|nr:Tma23p [Saccharomyces cerevisiae YJM1078]AJS63879.1 Tma23p [Saccharomyces cerevisiae YJM248]AJS64317.1 Tma23p [Saccharomyces cerevisiae YJM270]AJS81349.1 Tma23p [Saccharomyces cerevisiae YJM1252]AJT00526.1 Tma23p [Saccharomyces cerevisiae YJM1574]PTN19013.1 Tma23p [Saccharomyces cerevisiae]CAY82101.1 Tma23p [Saccharomyces cerevisiae EC1118]